MNGQHNKKEGILFRHLLKFLCVWLEGRLRKGNWKQRSMHRYGGRPHFVRTKKRCSVCHCRYVSRLIAKECHVPEGGQKTNNK